VHDFANYGQLQRIANPSIEGAVAYAVEAEQVVLRAGGVANPRQQGNTSGTLCLELWAFAEPYAGGEPHGQRLAGAELGSIWGGYHLPEIERRAPFTPPPPGRWQLSLLLREWTLTSGYTTRDYRNFDVVYEREASEPAAPAFPATAFPATPLPASAALPVPAGAPAAEKPETLRLVRPAAAESPAARAAATVAPVEVAAPAEVSAPAEVAAPTEAKPAAQSSGLVSLNTASVEELAKLPGVSLKVAKEIVKNRPFTALDALIQVRGIGDKTLRRIKSLLSS
jgi:competence protein ComEA